MDKLQMLQDWAIPGLAIAVVVCIIAILWLWRLLVREKHRRIQPLLNLVIDPNTIELCIKNDSDCTAKNIVIGDLKFSLDYEFQKKVTVKFLPIELLEAHQCIKLPLSVWDGQFDITLRVQNSIGSRFVNAEFTLPISFSNIGGIRFNALIKRKGGRFTIEQLRLFQ